MSSEFRVLSAPPPAGEYRDILEYPEIEGVTSWLAGQPIGPLQSPIGLQWDPSLRGARKSLYQGAIPLLITSALDALERAGIDNLQRFAVTLLDPSNGEVCRDYEAFNVVGLVRAADLNASSWSDPSRTGLFDMDFDSLAIDPERARGHSLFRLAECVTAILVAERVSNRLLAEGGYGLEFVDPAAWMG